MTTKISPWPFAFTFLSLTAILGLAGVALQRLDSTVAAEVALDGAKGEGHNNSRSSDSAVALEPSPLEIWSDLLEGNRRFVRGALAARPVLGIREKLAKGQHPKVMVLGCADSRVPPEFVFDKSLGDLFVVRTAGNIADPVALGSLEYAAEHLHATILVVLGHEKCGAVAAAASGETMPSANLEAIVKRIQPAIHAVNPATPKDEVSIAQVEANVQLSAKNLLAESPILREAVEKAHVTIFKGVYMLASGEVTKLR